MVSIIVPAYNAESYIDKCIGSLVSQTFADIEVIVIDDGSKDGTWSKLQAWSDKDKRVFVRHFDNAGVVTTRSRGLSLATGEHLMFVDADDYLPSDAVEQMVEAARSCDGGADIVVGDYSLLWAETGKIVPVLHKKGFTTPTECAVYCLRYGETFLPIKLYRTSLFREVVDIPVDIKVQEDTIGVLQYLGACKSATYVEQNTYFYLKHLDSASYSLSQKHLSSMLKVASMLCDMYRDDNNAELMTEVIKTCIRNLYTYIRHTASSVRDTDSIHKVMHFISDNDRSSLPLSFEYRYMLYACMVSDKHPALSQSMIRLYAAYTNTMKYCKQCVRKLIK